MIRITLTESQCRILWWAIASHHRNVRADDANKAILSLMRAAGESHRTRRAVECAVGLPKEYLIAALDAAIRGMIDICWILKVSTDREDIHEKMVRNREIRDLIEDA